VHLSGLLGNFQVHGEGRGGHVGCGSQPGIHQLLEGLADGTLKCLEGVWHNGPRISQRLVLTLRKEIKESKRPVRTTSSAVCLISKERTKESQLIMPLIHPERLRSLCLGVVSFCNLLGKSQDWPKKPDSH
jgi:hypothetical protein